MTTELRCFFCGQSATSEDGCPRCLPKETIEQNLQARCNYLESQLEQVRAALEEYHDWIVGRFVLPTYRCVECGLIARHDLSCDVGDILARAALAGTEGP